MKRVHNFKDILSLKANECFAIFSNNGETTSEDHGIYLYDTCFLKEYSWEIPGFVLLNTEIKDSQIMIQHFGRIRGHKQTVELVRTFKLLEKGFIDELSFKHMDLLTEEDLDISLQIEESFVDIFSIRGWTSFKPTQNIEKLENKTERVIRHTSSDKVQSEIRIKPNITEKANNHWTKQLTPKESWTLQIQTDFSTSLEFTSPANIPDTESWSKRFKSITVPLVDQKTWKQAIEDLRAIMITTPRGLCPVAGIPRFVCPFGRDAFWTILMLMPFAPDIAKQTIQYFSDHQGAETNDFREESPGKIPHEIRKGELSRIGKIPFAPYYGTVDATPLFIICIEEYYKQTKDFGLIQELQPSWESALEWIVKQQDQEHGMLAFSPNNVDSGLSVQSWKDSADSMSHNSGKLASPPIAVSEVQGYVFRAFKAASLFYRQLNELDKSSYWEAKAKTFGDSFHKLFWNDTQETYALALDKDNQPLTVQNSDAGHLLWCGIVPEKYAPILVKTLLSKENWSGWGLRTLGQSEKRYNPLSYHNGSVWPHDTAIFGGGLHRYGFSEELKQVREAIFSLANSQPDNRVPELISGYERDTSPIIPYPTACRPQAWSAAAVIYIEHLLNC